MKIDKQKQRDLLYGLLGDLPSSSYPVSSKKVAEEKRGNYILEKLVLNLNGIEDVPAYFVKPENIEGRIPVILYNHAH